jgi:uncharacterized protein (TIRG00374 family)
MKRWYFWIGVIISVFFLFLALRGLELGTVWDTIQRATYWWLIPAVLVYFLAVLARTWRWHYLLQPVKPIPTREIFAPVCIGYMGNNVFPARAGELLRAVVLKRQLEVSISASLATILVERIFDGIVVLGFVFLNIGSVITKDEFRYITLWGAAIFITVFLILLLAAIFPHNIKSIVKKTVNIISPVIWREKLISFFSRFIDGLSSLRSPKALTKVLGVSLVIWIIESSVYWLVMQAFSFNVGFLNLVFLNGVVNLVTTLPSAPGYIGTFEAPGIAILKLFEVPGAEAAGFMLVLHAVLWLPITLVGAALLFKSGIQMDEELEKVNQGKDKA